MVTRLQDRVEVPSVERRVPLHRRRRLPLPRLRHLLRDHRRPDRLHRLLLRQHLQPDSKGGAAGRRVKCRQGVSAGAMSAEEGREGAATSRPTTPDQDPADPCHLLRHLLVRCLAQKRAAA